MLSSQGVGPWVFCARTDAFDINWRSKVLDPISICGDVVVPPSGGLGFTRAIDTKWGGTEGLGYVGRPVTVEETSGVERVAVCVWNGERTRIA